MLIKLDPLRTGSGPNRIPPTGITVRALNGSRNIWDNHDLSELDRDSLFYILRILWGVREDVARLLLFYMGHKV